MQRERLTVERRVLLVCKRKTEAQMIYLFFFPSVTHTEDPAWFPGSTVVDEDVWRTMIDPETAVHFTAY